jgi:Tol biopolymer transport system component
MRRGWGAFGVKRLVVIGAVLMMLAGTLGQAHATVRGKNGRIAYRRYLNQAQTRGAIFTIRPNGTGVRQLTHPHRKIVTDEPDWSPNGRWIVYQRENARTGFSKLFKIRPDGSNRTYLSRTCGRICGDSFAAWSPKGTRIAFQRDSCGTGMHNLLTIYVMRSDGTNPRRVVQRDATCATSHRYEDHAPQWSPSGKRLAFERLDHRREKQAIFIQRLDGTGLRRLTPWSIDASQPDWSPNGRWIAFRTQEQSETKGNIALVHPDGTGFHRITHNRGTHKWLSCSFSPNGKKIQAGRARGHGEAGNADIYVMNLDGTGRRNLTRSGAWESASDWGP